MGVNSYLTAEKAHLFLSLNATHKSLQTFVLCFHRLIQLKLDSPFSELEHNTTHFRFQRQEVITAQPSKSLNAVL